jgi:hypothetical protein
MNSLLTLIAVVLVLAGLMAAAAIFWRAITGHLPYKNATPEASKEVYWHLWPLCIGGLAVGILLLLLVRGCAK